MPRVVHHDIDVAASPEACWRVATQLSLFPQWFPFLREAEHVGGAGADLVRGAAFRLLFGFGPMDVAVRCRVTDTLPVERLCWRGEGRGLSGEHALLLRSRHPSLTRVTHHVELSGAGALLVPARVWDRVDEELHTALGRLRLLIEQQPVGPS